MKYKVVETLPVGRRVREREVDWAAAKEAVIENEGKWVLMAENVSSSTPGQLTRGRNRHFRGPELDHFEFRTRMPDPPKVYTPKRSDLWGRYHA